MLLSDIYFLKNYRINHLVDYENSPIPKNLEVHKVTYINEYDQENAKYIWCLEQVFEIQYLYKLVWFQMQQKDFYKAWCTLEKCENVCNHLKKHALAEFDKYGYMHIFEQVCKFQSLFPYKIFMSPEMLEKKLRCNICDSIVSMRNHCGHFIGEIYDGEMCIRIVEDLEFLGVAMVKHPVQKYSVPFMKDEETGEQIDQYNYQLLEYLLERIDNEFSKWHLEKNIKEYSTDYFRHVPKNDLCPCESGQIFEKCCLPKRIVKMPHYQFHFDVISSEKAFSILKIDNKQYNFTEE